MTIFPDHMSDRLRMRLATLGVVGASMAFGFVPYFARGLTDAGLAPFAVAFYRYFLVAALFFPLMLRALWNPVTRGAALWGLGAGVVMGIGWVGYVRALQEVPVGTAGVIYMSYPVFTLVVAWGVFADRPSGRAMLAAGLILIAALVAGGAEAMGPAPLRPLILALAAPFGFGVGIAVLVHRLTVLQPLARLTVVCCGSVLGLLPLVLTVPADQVIPPNRDAWLLVGGIALITALVPQLVYCVCSPMVGAARTAMAGAVELPMMFALGWVAYGEHLGTAQWVAGALVLGAIILTPTRATRNVSINIARPKGGFRRS